MKNKGVIAVVIGVICALILSGVLIWSAFDKPSEDENNTPDTSVQDQGGETPQPTPSAPDNVTDGVEEDAGNAESNTPEEKEPDTNAPETDNSKPDTTVKPTDDEEDQKDETPVTVGAVDPDPKTAEGIKALLNDPLLILVNRDHKVSSDYAGYDLVSYNSDHKMNRVAAEALKKFIAAGRTEGYNYILYSGYRTYTRQYNNYYNKIAYWKNQGKSEEEALRLTNQYYAPPGASEHQTGLAADVCIPKIVNEYACLHEDYAFTDEFKWFSTHAHEYGFILRYRLGDEDITGYSYEPWHYRYVGVEVATEIYKRDITFEEYIEGLEARLKQLEG